MGNMKRPGAPIGEKATVISTEIFRPLEVEWTVSHPHLRQPDDSFKQVERHEVTLTYPGNMGTGRTRIVTLSAHTALALLDWLQENKADLERHAQEEA